VEKTTTVEARALELLRRVQENAQGEYEAASTLDLDTRRPGRGESLGEEIENLLVEVDGFDVEKCDYCDRRGCGC
jgi:hypothetical protein